MDLDDLPLRKSDELTALEKQDLSEMGVEELTDRIDRLKTEITRAEQARKDRGDSKAAAEAVFG